MEIAQSSARVTAAVSSTAAMAVGVAVDVGWPIAAMKEAVAVSGVSETTGEAHAATPSSNNAAADATGEEPDP
jgi:hypothetical protein